MSQGFKAEFTKAGLAALALGVVFYAGTAEAKKAAEKVPAVIVQADRIPDPAENVNRGTQKFNTGVDHAVIRPVAKGYREVTNDYARERVSSFLRNLSAPVDLLNSALQGDVQNSFTITWRFIINTTLGVGGLFDTAADAGLKYQPEDFDQTLATYGVGTGPYIVLPILGPSSARGTVGLVVDSLTQPLNYTGTGLVAARVGSNVVSNREAMLDATDAIEDTSFDTYSAYRSAYVQRRNALINNQGTEERKPTTLTEEK